jgi:hypothetical protein
MQVLESYVVCVKAVTQQTGGVSFFNNDFADYAFIVNLASIRSFEGYNVAWFMVLKKRDY